jgi:RNA-directed DNA polymerase
VFANQTRGYTGEPRMLALIAASDTRIVKHVRVKSDANPFDPAWDSYFAQRKGARMLEQLQARGFPKRLWQQQHGKCPGCGQLIDEDDRWAISATQRPQRVDG